MPTAFLSNRASRRKNACSTFCPSFRSLLAFQTTIAYRAAHESRYGDSNCGWAQGLEAKTYAKVDRRLIPFLFLCYILAYLDRVNWGSPSSRCSQDLALSDAAFGTGRASSSPATFLFEVPSNLLLKKFGARTWIARIMVSWGILSSAMMWVKSEWAFYAVRFLLGVAEAGFFPGIIFYLTLWYPSRCAPRGPRGLSRPSPCLACSAAPSPA